MVVHRNIVVRKSAISGTGLYAVGVVKKGEICWQADPDEEAKYWVKKEVVDSWPEDVRKQFYVNAYQVKPGVFSGIPPGVVDTDGGEYMNHCCNANTIFIDDNTMVACRDVAEGEEITYDYATSETPSSSHMPFQCLCGTPVCRGEISGFDFLKPELRAKYASNFTSMVRELQDVADAAARKAVEEKVAADAAAM